MMEADEDRGVIALDEWDETKIALALINGVEGREYEVRVAGELVAFGTCNGATIVDGNVTWNVAIRPIEPLRFITVKGKLLD